jgi:outer membrane protein assembly factor BamB
VTPPKFDLDKPGYDDFKASASGRLTTIYMGSNDGMLHAFNETDGTEKWAYIPNCVLYKLYKFKDGQKFTTDGPLTIGDINFGGDGNGQDSPDWRTVLVGGMGRGEKYYYALDVTDPESPKFLWEKTDADSSGTDGGVMGFTWSPAALGHIYVKQVYDKNIPVVFVGGGYSPDAATGNRVYIIHAETGAILKEFAVGLSGNNVPSGIRTVRYSMLNGVPVDYTQKPRTPMEPAELYNNNIEVAYFGDTNGSLWRIGPDEDGVGGLNSRSDDSGAWADNVHLVKLYDPDEDQPIFHMPAVVDYPSGGCRFVLFGTGNELDQNDPAQQYFAEVEDRELTDVEKSMTDAEKNKVRMTWRTGEDNVTPIGQGEHVLSNPATYKGTVYFTTYKAADQQVAANQCSPEIGDGFLYGLTVSRCSSKGGEDGLTEEVITDENGQPIIDPNTGDTVDLNDGYTIDPDTGQIIDPNGNGLVDPVTGQPITGKKTSITTGVTELGSGFPTSPTISSPRLTVIQTQDGKKGNGSLPIPVQRNVPTNPANILMWREVD